MRMFETLQMIMTTRGGGCEEEEGDDNDDNNRNSIHLLIFSRPWMAVLEYPLFVFVLYG